MGRKMIINCSMCDTRKVREETLAEFEHITINASLILVSQESKLLLDKYPVQMNCSDVVELDGNVQMSAVNGVSQIKSSDPVGGKRYMVVNGSVEIGPGTEKVLENYIGITVNGSATYPDSISGHLGMMKVNGSTTCYPDGAIVLKRNAVIDKLFTLRAKNSLYWAAKRMIMVDPALDPARLEAKGVSFSTKEVILAEGLVEGLIGMIDEQAEIVIVPDGTTVILDDVDLDDTTVKKHGEKLYIIGDLKVAEDSADALKDLKYLNVRGDVRVAESLKDLLTEIPGEITGDVEIMRKSKGRVIFDQMNVTVTKWLLEQSPEGLHIEDVMTVKVVEDVPKELILERLTVSDVMTVMCSDEQKDAMTAVCNDVMTIGSREEADKMGIGDMIKSSMGAVADLLNTKVVNCSEYVM